MIFGALRNEVPRFICFFSAIHCYFIWVRRVHATFIDR